MKNLMKTFIDILVGYMTIAVLATQLNLGEKPFWVHFLKDKHMKILVVFAAAQAACNNWRASLLATYIYYFTLDNTDSVIMFIKEIRNKKDDDKSSDEKESDEKESETKDEESEDSLKMFF